MKRRNAIRGLPALLTAPLWPKERVERPLGSIQLKLAEAVRIQAARSMAQPPVFFQHEQEQLSADLADDDHPQYPMHPWIGSNPPRRVIKDGGQDLE